jgi:lipopolysaccharide export system protein LptA
VIAVSLAAVLGCVSSQGGKRAQADKDFRKGASKAVTATPTPEPVAVSYPQRRPLDKGRPVHIKSDRMRYYDKHQETEFLGHVVATQDTAVLHADLMRSSDQGQTAWASGHVQLLDVGRKVELLADWGDFSGALSEANLCGGVIMHSVDPYAVPVTVTGETCWYQGVSRKARLDGGVTLWRGGLTATADTAIMNGGGEIVELRGKVVAQMGVNRVVANTAVMDGTKKSVIFDGKVVALLVPSQIQDRASHPEKP